MHLHHVAQFESKVDTTSRPPTRDTRNVGDTPRQTNDDKHKHEHKAVDVAMAIDIVQVVSSRLVVVRCVGVAVV